jgi:hypothetical protein
MSASIWNPGESLVDSKVTVVENVASLRLISALDNISTVATQGYYTRGDGGFGFYYFDPLDTTSADNGGSVIVNTVGGRWKLLACNIFNPKQWGARGDGVSIDTPYLIACGVAASASAGFIYLPKYDFPVENWTLPAGLIIKGEGILKRPNNSATNNSVIILQNGGNVIEGSVTLDGNKNNQTLAANTVSIVGGNNYKIKGASLINAKKVAGGYGSGLAIVSTTDLANGTFSDVEGCLVAANDADGVYVDEAWNIRITNNEAIANLGSGIALTNYDAPLEVDTIRRVSVVDNQCRGNGGSGILISGTTITNVLPPVGSSPARNILVTDNTCSQNAAYGIAAQSAATLVDSNICEENGNDGSGRVTYGGILFNCVGSTCSNNIVELNEFYGIDAGGAYECSVSNNNVRFNGNTTAGGGTGINIGGAVNTAVTNNTLQSNGTAAGGTQIYCPAYDSNGSQMGGLPYRSSNNLIKNNQILLGNANQVGIYLSQQPQFCSVRGNEIANGTLANAIINESVNSTCKDNIHLSFQGGLTVASAASLSLPDMVDTISVTGTTVISGGITTNTRAAYNQKVNGITITNPGSGYTSPPTVAFSGGGGTGAAALAYIGSSGTLVGVIITNAGSGYTSTPTIAFSGGGGSGAAATAVVGCNNIVNKDLTIFFSGNATVNAGSNISLSGGVNFVPGASGNSTLTLKGNFGSNWYEVGRCIA